MRRVFIGIDAGSLKSVSWLAYLEGKRFRLDQYDFTPEHTHLPWLSEETTKAVAIDAPQGLPESDGPCRQADIEAKTPARALPVSRKELQSGHRVRDGIKYPYIGLVRLGCEIFWSNREHLHGLDESTGKLVETYPLAILRCWMEGKGIPSKRKAAHEYVKTLTQLLRAGKYSWEGEDKLRVDYYDAMLCALAAKAHWEGTADYLGAPPIVDSAERILREGFIVVPKHVWLYAHS